MTTAATWCVMDVLRESESFLAKKGIENPRLNAERLLGSALNLSRVELYLKFDKPLEEAERAACRSLLKRRAAQEPLQYILGETEFMSLPFLVAPGVLIPRPETETLVERALTLLAESGPGLAVLDLGTGSGCIAVSIAHYQKDARVTAVDISKEALRIAAQNADRNGTAERIDFVWADILSEDPADYLAGAGGFDAVLANPPYISLEEWPQLPEEVQQWEPRNSLCDEGDGLSYYRRIAESMYPFLTAGGALMFEIGYAQAYDVKSILRRAGYGEVNVEQDLSGKDRIVTACR